MDSTKHQIMFISFKDKPTLPPFPHFVIYCTMIENISARKNFNYANTLIIKHSQWMQNMTSGT